MNPVVLRVIMGVLSLAGGIVPAAGGVGADMAGFLAGPAGLVGGLALPAPKYPWVNKLVFLFGAVLAVVGEEVPMQTHWLSLVTWGSGACLALWKSWRRKEGVAAAATLALVGVLMSSSSACAGMSPEAAVVTAVDQGLKAVAGAILEEKNSDIDEILERTQQGTAQREELEDLLKRWEPMDESYKALAAAFKAYRAVRSSDHRRALMAAWEVARAAAKSLNFELPFDHSLAAALAGGLP